MLYTTNLKYTTSQYNISINFNQDHFKCSDCAKEKATYECRQCGVQHLMELFDDSPDADPLSYVYYCENCCFALEVLVVYTFTYLNICKCRIVHEYSISYKSRTVVQY